MPTRGYFVVNRYMLGLQAGIQAGHCAAELVHEHHSNSVVKQWVTKDKVMIVLHGGGHSDLRKLFKISQKMKIPSSIFHEGLEDLNGAATCVGMVLSDSLVEKMKTLAGAQVLHAGDDETCILALLKGLPLAK